MARIAPKNCIVTRVELDGKGNAEIGYRCERDGYMETGQHSYTSPSGGTANYPSKRVKARTVAFRGMYVSGPARVDFVMSPASAVCHKNGSEIRCKLEGETSGSLAGSRRRRRR